MSASTLPISPTAFAAALKDLPISTLHLKAAETRNSIAHLDYSNEQLRPFADGTQDGQSGPDADCAEAIKENEIVIKRMLERIELLKLEVEARGGTWREFLTKEELEAERGADVNGTGTADTDEHVVNGDQLSEAWRDGTFQTGQIVNGEVVMDQAPITNGVNGATINGQGGGSVGDDELRRAMEERMRALGDDSNEDGGMHL